MPSGVYVKTKEHRENLSKALKGKPSKTKGKKYTKEEYPDFGNRNKSTWLKGLTKETDERVAKMSKEISKSLKGKAPWNKNLTKEIDERVVKNAKNISKALKKNWQNPEHRKKRIEAIKVGWSMPGAKMNASEGQTKRYENPEERGKQSRIMKLVMNGPEVRMKISKTMKIVMNRPETKEKERIAWEKRVESSGYPKNYLVPSFNFNSILIFKTLDKVLHTRGRYGGTRAGEKKIGRYFVDYYNKGQKLTIEWMENWHYNNGHLSEKDIKKREYILDKYPNYTYIIIKQDNWFGKDNLTKEIAVKIVNHILEKLRIKRND